MLYICSIKEQELIGGHKLVASLIIKNTQQTEMPHPESPLESITSMFLVFSW